jgi:Tfp pilus assembly protein PilO
MSIFDQLNLRPNERRALVIVLVAVFVVVNIYFVRPIFGEFGRVKAELNQQKATLNRYQAEIQKAPAYEKQEAELKESGSSVLTAELELQRIVSRQAVASNVQVNSYRGGSGGGLGRTNQFFEEQTLTIDFNTGARELVEFLIGLASGNSMVRVREMNVRNDPTRTRLVGHIVFVASYQKKAPAANAAGTTAVGAFKPAAPPKGSTVGERVMAEKAAAPA